MLIKLLPLSSGGSLDVSKAGDILQINGEAFDFSRLDEGDTLPCSAISSEWFFGDVERVIGELVVTLFLPNPTNASHEQRFPVDLVNVPDGPVALPQPNPAPQEAVE